MMHTKNDASCQHCGREKATNRIIWEDDDGELWFEDWCSDCAQYADDHVDISPIGARMQMVDGVFYEVQ
jgi:hypothetical protein